MFEHSVKIFKRQLAIEYSCDPSDFGRDENVLTRSVLREGRRAYSETAPFFSMVTFGGNAVITADDRLHPFLKEFMAGKQGFSVFGLVNLPELQGELARFGQKLQETAHMFLPDRIVENKTIPYETKWFTDAQIRQFYGDGRFVNAICPEYNPQRPDRIVVCAYDRGEIIAMAGCSEDAPHLMQIGIDVMPQHRGKGIGKALVNLLKNRIHEKGDLPFYGTGVTNFYSWRIALACGFKPAFAEMYSIQNN